MDNSLANTGPQSYGEFINALNERDRQTGYKEPRLLIKLNGTNFDVHVQGSTEPIKSYRSLSGQIIYAKKTRSLYDPRNRDSRLPLCSSRDGNVHGSPNVEFFSALRELEEAITDVKNIVWEPFSSQRPLCRGCLFDQWGTGLSVNKETKELIVRKGGKACGVRKLLVILLPDFERPLTMSLSLSSASQFDAYAGKFSTLRPQKNYIQFLTKMTATQETKKDDATVKWEVVHFEAEKELEPNLVYEAAAAAQPFTAERVVDELFETEDAPATNGGEAPKEDLPW